MGTTCWLTDGIISVDVLLMMTKGVIDVEDVMAGCLQQSIDSTILVFDYLLSRHPLEVCQ